MSTLGQGETHERMHLCIKLGKKCQPIPARFKLQKTTQMKPNGKVDPEKLSSADLLGARICHGEAC